MAQHGLGDAGLAVRREVGDVPVDEAGGEGLEDILVELGVRLRDEGERRDVVEAAGRQVVQDVRPGGDLVGELLGRLEAPARRPDGARAG